MSPGTGMPTNLYKHTALRRSPCKPTSDQDARSPDDHTLDAGRSVCQLAHGMTSAKTNGSYFGVQAPLKNSKSRHRWKTALAAGAENVSNTVQLAEAVYTVFGFPQQGSSRWAAAAGNTVPRRSPAAAPPPDMHASHTCDSAGI